MVIHTCLLISVYCLLFTFNIKNMPIIIFIIILLVLVIAHEFGHFIVAKKSGIRVDEFAFGFPPKIFSKKIGETTYAFNALPIGGYVKIYGEDPTQVKSFDANRSFPHKKKIIQSAVILAGIFANLIVAWILFSIILMIGMRTSSGANYFGELKNVEVVVTQVLDNSPAKEAGIISGDAIVSMQVSGKDNKIKIEKSSQVTDFVGAHPNEKINLDIIRKDENKTYEVTPKVGISGDGRAVIGIAMDEAGILKLAPHKAILEGAIKTYDYTIYTVVGISSFIVNAITGHGNFNDVSGPVGIVGAVGDAAKLGFVHILMFAAIISINLAVINLIPFPALDGGRFLFIIIESIIRKPLPVKATSLVNAFGFALLMLLMIVVTYHDIAKLFQ